MKTNDIIRAVWTDGLVVVGKYVRTERGFIILLDDSGNQVVCNPSVVKFEVINEAR